MLLSLLLFDYLSIYQHFLSIVLDAGHAMWPAIVLDESHVGDRKGLKKISGEKSLPVQFFGTHDFARCVI